MTTLRMISLTVLLASALTLTACGGGGSAGDTDEKGSGTVDFTPPDHQGDSGGGGTGPTDEISEARARWDASAIADYDFEFGAVNFNVVYRWEYRPGSTVYLVWTHAKNRYENGSGHAGEPDWRPEFDGGFPFRAEPENTFLAKISYWFSI